MELIIRKTAKSEYHQTEYLTRETVQFPSKEKGKAKIKISV